MVPADYFYQSPVRVKCLEVSLMRVPGVFGDEAYITAICKASDIPELLTFLEAEWAHDYDESVEVTTYRHLFERAYMMASTPAEALLLWNEFLLYSASGDTVSSYAVLENRVLERAIEFITTNNELHLVYCELAMTERELYYRRLIRMLFDKVDVLGYPEHPNQDRWQR